MTTLFDAISANAHRQPRALALSDSQIELPYGELDRAIADVATLLPECCPEPGPIALCLSNSVAWALLDLALMRLERAMVPLPTFFTPGQRAHAMDETGAAYLITDQKPRSGWWDAFSILGRILYCSVWEHDQDPAASLPSGTAKVTYTSGSTGQPKGVCLSGAGLETVASSIVERVGTERAGTHCAALPLAILLENVAGLYPTLMAGGRYYMPSPEALGLQDPFRPDFVRFVGSLAECRATSVIMVPELLRGTMRALKRMGLSLPNLELLAVGGATVSLQLLAEAESLGLPVVQGYGLSEMGSVVALNNLADNAPGTVGSPLAHVRIECAPDGELVIHDPVFLGYVGSGKAPRVYATGDLGDIDATGRIRLFGRKSDLIITSFGRNVGPEWVESELLSEPAIAQAFVFGEGAPSLGALVVPAAADDVALAAAIARANERLPDYAAVRHWSIVTPFTAENNQLTRNGRLRRATITEEHRDRMASCLQHSGHYRSFHDRLVANTAVERAALQNVAQIQDALRGLVSRDSYLAYLTEAYHHVKHTVPLMELTAALLSPEQRWLREALAQYIAEETGHERWILDDIGNAGGDPEATRTGTPRPATQRMVAYAYDYITRVNPVGFFGMVFVLEGTSTQLALQGANALMKSTQLPRECFSYLLSHGALDVSHMAFFRALMDQLTQERDQLAVVEVAQTMFKLFGDVFASIPHERPAANVA